MIVGNPMRRVDDIDPDTTEAHDLTFRCFQGTDPGPFGSPGKGPEDSFHLPLKMCTGGIRTNIFYPQCVYGFR